MAVLLIHAHPDPDSLSHAIAAAAADGLRAGGREVTVVDLYAEGFAPAMSAEEHRAYETAEPILDDQVRRYAELVRDADTIVFVYPTWWFGLPAVLKGFLERVLVPGVAFVLDPRTRRIRPGLHRTRRLVGISTYGSPRSYVRVLGDPGRRTITRTVRLSCNRRCRARWHGLYAVDTSTAEERAAFLEHIRREMAQL